jgi:hypothetical protein
MNFEMAATDASQERPPLAGPETGPDDSSRPAPFAASLEVALWTALEFEVPISGVVVSQNRPAIHPQP